jgi:hypothetical protein
MIAALRRETPGRSNHAESNHPAHGECVEAPGLKGAAAGELENFASRRGEKLGIIGG